MNNTLPIIDKINAIYAAIVLVLTYILGKYWFLFVFFLFLNACDYITGWYIKSRKNGKSNSKKGAEGIKKKLGYWIMICIAFGMSVAFIQIGKVIGIDLSCTSAIGYFVLASLIINEIRSNIENLVEAGYNIPVVLVKGLEIANKAIDGKLKIDVETGNVETDISADLIKDQKKVTLEVEQVQKKG